MTSRNLRRHIDDDDDPDGVFDENGVLRDGATWHVPLRLADAAQRAVAAHAAARQASVTPLHAPGFVRTTDAAGAASKEAAYRDYETSLVDAWKGEPIPPTGAGAQVPDRPRTAAPSAPTPRPAARATVGDAAARDAAYTDYDNQLRSAWMTAK